MSLRRKVSESVLNVTGYIGILLGFNTFYYHKRHESFINRKPLLIYSKIMALSFFALYPMAMYKCFYEGFIPTTVTDYTRIAFSIIYWLLTFVIYLNQTSNSTTICEIYNRALSLFRQQDIGGDINSSNFDGLMNKCALRVAVLLVGFVIINYMKVTKTNDWTTPFDYVLFVYVFIPNFIITLASNRFYTAALFFLHLIVRGNEYLANLISDWNESKLLKSEKLTILSRNRAAMQKVFNDFHRVYAKYFICVFAFCIFNSIFEVKLFLIKLIKTLRVINSSCIFYISTCRLQCALIFQ